MLHIQTTSLDLSADDVTPSQLPLLFVEGTYDGRPCRAVLQSS